MSSFSIWTVRPSIMPQASIKTTGPIWPTPRLGQVFIGTMEQAPTGSTMKPMRGTMSATTGRRTEAWNTSRRLATAQAARTRGKHAGKTRKKDRKNGKSLHVGRTVSRPDHGFVRCREATDKGAPQNGESLQFG